MTSTQFHKWKMSWLSFWCSLNSCPFCQFTVPCWTNICGKCWIHRTYHKFQRLEPLSRLFRSMISWKWIRIVCDHFQNLAHGDVADALESADLKHLEVFQSILKHWAAGPCHFCTALAEVQYSLLLLLLNLQRQSRQLTLTWIFFFPMLQHITHIISAWYSSPSAFARIWITCTDCLPCRPKTDWMQAPKEWNATCTIGPICTNEFQPALLSAFGSPTPSKKKFSLTVASSRSCATWIESCVLLPRDNASSPHVALLFQSSLFKGKLIKNQSTV